MLVGVGFVGLIASGFCASRSFGFMSGDEFGSVDSERLITELRFWSNLASIIGSVAVILLTVGLFSLINEWLNRLLNRPRS